MCDKSKAWPLKKRAKMAETIKKHKPWLKSTGAKTPEGKATVSRNAYRHGFRSEDYKKLCVLLQDQAQLIKNIQSMPLLVIPEKHH